jgi:hypothetical protein
LVGQAEADFDQLFKGLGGLEGGADSCDRGGGGFLLARSGGARKARRFSVVSGVVPLPPSLDDLITAICE